jgi:DNA-binding transcriptional regulator YiaG
VTKVDVLDYAIAKNYRADKDGNIYGPTGAKLKQAKTRNGYLFFGVRKPIASEGTFNVSSHRFVAYYFLGQEAKTSEVIRHLDGDKTNNKLSNLKPGTKVENFGDNDDTWKKEFALAGAATKRKLNEEEVKAIREMISEKVSYSKMAAAFGVSKGCIQQIKEGKSYAWVK